MIYVDVFVSVFVVCFLIIDFIETKRVPFFVCQMNSYELKRRAADAKQNQQSEEERRKTKELEDQRRRESSKRQLPQDGMFHLTEINAPDFYSEVQCTKP